MAWALNPWSFIPLLLCHAICHLITWSSLIKKDISDVVDCVNSDVASFFSWSTFICDLKMGIPPKKIASFQRWTPWMGADQPAGHLSLPRASLSSSDMVASKLSKSPKYPHYISKRKTNPKEDIDRVMKAIVALPLMWCLKGWTLHTTYEMM